MIYIIVGGSHAGKSQLVYNTWLKGKQFKEYKDILTICETDECFVIGPYSGVERRKGTDKVARKDIPRFFDQIKRLMPKGKDIILEGDKIINKTLFNSILESEAECQLIWVKHSLETSIKRNEAFGNSVASVKSLKTPLTKSKNIFKEYGRMFNGMIIDTDNITDFKNFNLNTAEKIFPFSDREINVSEPRDDFAVFIPSNGRANNIQTMKALERGNYSGKIYIVVDDLDTTINEYRERYGSDVIVFDKKEAARITDTGNNFKDMRAVVYARNEIPNIAKRMGLKYFLVLDDDYTDFMWRFIEGRKLGFAYPKDLNAVFDAMCEFLEASGAVTVTFAQGGDFIGGKDNQALKKGLLRKAMNTWFCSTDRYFKFYGQINEDTTAYVLLGGRGELFFTVPDMMVNQNETQSNPNGLTTIYLDNGTYVKSFYSVMYCPSCVKVALMGEKHKRLHHRVDWASAVPKIIDECYKKVIL